MAVIWPGPSAGLTRLGAKYVSQILFPLRQTSKDTKIHRVTLEKTGKDIVRRLA